MQMGAVDLLGGGLDSLVSNFLYSFFCFFFLILFILKLGVGLYLIPAMLNFVIQFLTRPFLDEQSDVL